MLKNKISLLLILTISVLGCQPEAGNMVSIPANGYTNTPFLGHGVQWAAYHHGDCENEWARKIEGT